MVAHFWMDSEDISADLQINLICFELAQ